MSLDVVKELLNQHQASLRLADDDLVMRGPPVATTNTELIRLIKDNKPLIVDRLRRGDSFGVVGAVPANRISPECRHITPDHLPLVSLTQEEIDRVVGRVPGGVGNVQDIYPLAPLQEGVLFHYLMAQAGDPYLMWSLISFAERDRLDAYVAAVNAVIARHDILRTAVIWEGLAEPVQVVWRRAELVMEEVRLDPALGDVAQQLKGKFHPRHYRLDITKAPLMRLFVAWDATRSRWLAMELKHHLMLDQATSEIVDSEVGNILEGRSLASVRGPSFREFVAELRLRPSRIEDEQFFRQQLSEITEPTAPFGLVDVYGDGSTIVEDHTAVHHDLANRIRIQAKRIGVSLATLFHVAWGLVLSRTSGRDNPVFGTVLFGRLKTDGVGRTVGPFINTLPIVMDFSGGSIEKCVLDTQRKLFDLLLHEQAPLPLVQRYSGLSAGSPLFSSVLNFRHRAQTEESHTAKGKAKATAVNGISVLDGDERNNYSLTLSVDDTGDEFVIGIQVHPSFDPRRLCNLLRVVLEEVVDGLASIHNKRIDELSVMLPEEAQMMRVWNETRVTHPPDKCVHHLFVEQARRTPEAVALLHNGTTLTYRELEQRSSRLAIHLGRLGVGRGSVVGLCSERSLDMVVGMLAIFRVGAAFLPLDPKLPIERLSYMMSDSGAQLALTSEEGAKRLQGTSIVAVSLRHMATSDSVMTSDARSLVEQGDPAYVLYTSGSTGMPKGVKGTHRAIVNRLLPQSRQISADCIFAHKTTISFIDALWEVWLPLIAGAKVVIFDHEVATDAAAFVDALNAHAVTHTVLVPALLSEILAALETSASELTALRHCACSGEALSSDIARAVRRLLPHVELVNIYGTTEFWDGTRYSVVSAESGALVPIGRPMENVRVYVLDHKRRPVPIGVTGDLYVAGSGLAIGYVNDGRLTDEKFLELSCDGNTRVYKSGDRARWRSDGVLEYMGRADHQVKRRGVRIEPAEIETVLRSYDGIDKAAVVTRTDGGESKLFAYATMRPTHRSSNAATMGFGLFYFSDAENPSGNDGFKLYLESVKAADRLGVDAIWTPERHFTTVGAPYPNPSVLSAAAAMVTEKLKLRSGSVVLPLHDSIRVAEEWAVVDRLSNGRVELSFASGWVPDDFVLASEAFEKRHEIMLEKVKEVQQLWRGESVKRRNGVGIMADIRIQPRPVQAELPTWITAGGSPRTFEDAGRLGPSVLTHLLNMPLSLLADKIRLYRSAREKAGLDPAAGRVAVMLHTYIAESESVAVNDARPHLETYFRSQLNLRKAVGESLGIDVSTTQADAADIVKLAADRYLRSKTLIGSPESCLKLLRELQGIGVNEVACLVDFGIEMHKVIASLEGLAELRRLCNRSANPNDIRTYLKSRLPDYMLPDAVIVSDSFPMTSSGKIDRNALPAPTMSSGTDRSYVAPRTHHEEALAAIWASLLKVDHVGINDSFFDLGGNSLSVIRMINQAAKKLGMKLSVRTVFENPTIAALAGLVADDPHSSAASVVVPLSSTKGSLSPLFCIHGGTGKATYYRRLSKYLGGARAIYGIQYPALARPNIKPQSFRELMTQYVEAIRTVQPNGPYNLLGWSFGGLAAYEVACQLQAIGQDVASLILLSPAMIGQRASRLSDFEALSYFVRAHGISYSEQQGELRDCALRLLKSNGVVQEQYGEDELNASLEVVKDIDVLRNQAVFGSFRGRAHLVAVKTDDLQASTARLQEGVRGDVEVMTVNCGHLQMFDDEWIDETGRAVARVLPA